MPTVLETFGSWCREDKNGCWVWFRSRNRQGYGQLRVDGVPRLAHRVAWERAKGPIPAGFFVLHRCDNPACVNPAHLFLGTLADNNRDMIAKGRHVSGFGKGENAGRALLNWAQVNAIRAEYAAGGTSMRRLAKEYGVSQGTIAKIVAGKNWNHPQNDPTTIKQEKARKSRRLTLVERFDQVPIRAENGCLIWPLQPSQDCGRVRVNGKKLRAYQFAFRRAHGPVPSGKVIRHTCDNRRCVNPEHLVLGTQADNIRDMYLPGRSRAA